MTSMAARHGTASSIPPTQITAPVHEFRCLYTHDVVRKQKRWQDGRVKYHTFNKRLMLYDDTLNFIGDTHWKKSDDLSVGDEVSLDTGVLIQVEDLLITTQTNLAPLFEREKSNQHQQQAKEDISKRVFPKLGSRRTIGHENVRHQHRSLSAVLNAGKDTHGKASLSVQSPFEVRKVNQENEWDSDRDSKRQKTARQNKVDDDPMTRSKDQMQPRRIAPGHGGDRLNLSEGRPNSRPEFGNQSKALRRQVIDITSEADLLPSDVTAPSSPKLPGTAARTVLESKQMKTVPRIPKPKSPAPPPVRTSSPPVSTKSKIRHMDNMPDHVPEAKPRSISPANTPTVAKIKQLRLAKTQQRPMLLCQKKPTQPVSEEPLAKPRKIKRKNLYLSLSDIEDEAEQREMTRPLAATTKGTSRKFSKMTVNPVDEPSSSTAAFDTGQSSSPRQTASRRKELAAQTGIRMVRKGLDKEDALDLSTDIDADESHAHDAAESRTKSPHAAKQPRQRVFPSKAAATGEQEDDGVDPYDVRTAKKKKRKQSQLKGQPLRNVVERSNEATREIDEGMGSRAMEERAKALAAAGPQRNQGPWTIEATDLFDWRPPDWETRVKAMGMVV